MIDSGPYDGSKILITGGMGFIGSSLARRLVGMGAKVTIIDSLIPEYGGNFGNIKDIRDKVVLNISDVRDPHAVSYLVQGQDFLFNLAGQTSHLDSMIDPRTDLEINASAQLSILEACRKHNPNVKIVFAGTRKVYGKPQYLPVDEKHPVNPVDVNGINKLAGEWYHLLYNNVYGIKACALRDRGFLSGLTGVWALPMPGSRWSVDEAGPNGASPGRERGDEAQSGGGAGRTTP